MTPLITASLFTLLTLLACGTLIYVGSREKGWVVAGVGSAYLLGTLLSFTLLLTYGGLP